jgi:hypothetical protein
MGKKSSWGKPVKPLKKGTPVTLRIGGKTLKGRIGRTIRLKTG